MILALFDCIDTAGCEIAYNLLLPLLKSTSSGEGHSSHPSARSTLPAVNPTFRPGDAADLMRCHCTKRVKGEKRRYDETRTAATSCTMYSSLPTSVTDRQPDAHTSSAISYTVLAERCGKKHNNN